MFNLILWALIILFIEFRTLLKNFNTPLDIQNKERYELISYIEEMKIYLGTKKFKYITIFSSLTVNSAYILYFLMSSVIVEHDIYRVITSFLIIDRVFKIIEIFELDLNKITYVVGSDMIIGIRSIITITHILLTITFIVFNLL